MRIIAAVCVVAAGCINIDHPEREGHVQDVGRDALAKAANDPGALESLFHDEVTNGGQSLRMIRPRRISRTLGTAGYALHSDSASIPTATSRTS